MVWAKSGRKINTILQNCLTVLIVNSRKLSRALLARRLTYFSPPILLVAGTTAALIFMWAEPAITQESESTMLRGLLQVIATIFSINVLGITINTNQFGQASSVRKLISDIREATEDIFATYYNAHPRDQKLQRSAWIRSLIKYTPVSELAFHDAQDSKDYFIFRPSWDGVWYQVHNSPFSTQGSEVERRAIAAVHEAALCALCILRQTEEMRNNNCGLLSETRGTNGSRWFLDDMNSIKGKLGLVNLAVVPATISDKSAGAVINLAISSAHYWHEEFTEHFGEADWEPNQLTQFCCYYVQYSIWMGFLWQKLQSLRLANLFRSKHKFPDALLQGTIKRLGGEAVDLTQRKLLVLENVASSEFGVANRFWLVRRAAVPGLSWAMLFLVLSALAWPLSAMWLGSLGELGAFSIVYGLGIVALLESLTFAYRLIWERKGGPPLQLFSTKPPQ